MWKKLVASFHDSEVLIWSRLQVVLGVLGSVVLALLHVVLQVDMSALFADPKYLVLWLVFSGLLTEFLRNRREAWRDPGPEGSEGPPGPPGKED